MEKAFQFSFILLQYNIDYVYLCNMCHVWMRFEDACWLGRNGIECLQIPGRQVWTTSAQYLHTITCNLGLHLSAVCRPLLHNHFLANFKFYVNKRRLSYVNVHIHLWHYGTQWAFENPIMKRELHSDFRILFCDVYHCTRKCGWALIMHRFTLTHRFTEIKEWFSIHLSHLHCFTVFWGMVISMKLASDTKEVFEAIGSLQLNLSRKLALKRRLPAFYTG